MLYTQPEQHSSALWQCAWAAACCGLWDQAEVHLWKRRVTCGVTVSTSIFLACHQCYCVGSSLTWGLNLRALVCGFFWSLSPGVFCGYSGFLPSFIGEWFSQWKKAQMNAISTLSNLIVELSLHTTWHVKWHVASDKRWMCCTYFAPGPLGCTCWRRFTAQWGDCKKSRIVPLNAIIIMIIIIGE